MARLLIVDNDARIVELTALFLGREGHEVETALSYAEAGARIDERRPDLMLADLDLGHEHGREELPRLAAEGRLPATLVVSGFLDAELEAELGRLEGVRGTLTKPVDLERLAARIVAEVGEGDAAGAPQAPLQAAEEDEEGWIEIVPLAPGVAPRAAEPAPERLSPSESPVFDPPERRRP